MDVVVKLEAAHQPADRRVSDTVADTYLRKYFAAGDEVFAVDVAGVGGADDNRACLLLESWTSSDTPASIPAMTDGRPDALPRAARSPPRKLPELFLHDLRMELRAARLRRWEKVRFLAIGVRGHFDRQRGDDADGRAQLN